MAVSTDPAFTLKQHSFLLLRAISKGCHTAGLGVRQASACSFKTDIWEDFELLR